MDFKQEYLSVWQAAWRFHKKFYDNDGSNQTWEQIVNESGEMVRKYEGKPEYSFIKDLVLAVISEIERVDKQRQTQEDKENEKK